jgi:hypothetical protein
LSDGTDPTPGPTPGPTERDVPGVPGPLPEPEPVRRPSTLGGMVYLVVVAAVAVGIAVTVFGPWRRGVTVVGCALGFAALARLVLRELDAGMLRVRGKAFDVVALAGVGAALVVLAAVIPDQVT